MAYKILISHGFVLAIGIAGMHNYMSTRHSLELERLAHGQTNEALDGANAALKRVNIFIEQGTRNAEATAKLQDTLIGLRGDVVSVRTDLGKRITTASRESLAEYAATCNAVLGAMAGGGERLSIIGAGIARSADGHAADARLIIGPE